MRVAALADGRIRNLAAPVARSSRTPVTASEYIESRTDALVPHGNYFGYHRNPFGFNGREPQGERGPESFRILGLGDSFTFGAVPYPRAYLRFAEACTSPTTPTGTSPATGWLA